MPVDSFVDKTVHSSYTGDHQGVGKLVRPRMTGRGLIEGRFSIDPHLSQALLLLLLALNL
jgi:hypothetical protein